MTEPPEWPPRPLPRRPASEIAHAWLDWVGLSRVLLTAIAVAVVVFGAVWLLRAPAPTTEAGLPFATTPALPPPDATTPRPASSVAVVTTQTQPIALVVHVAGAVVAPGVYELSPPARVADAVAAAGGPSLDGDLDGINMAAALADGQRVYVPATGEVDPASVPSGGGGAAEAQAPGATVAPGPIDLNTATAGELEQLPGVGPATAAAIIDDRERNGPFASVDDLDRVPGIGPAKLEAIRASVTA